MKEEQISREAYFILEVCVRQYFLVDGEEKTNKFFKENKWVISKNIFGQGIPSTDYMACCIDSILVSCNREKEEDLYKQFPNLEFVSRKVINYYFTNLQYPSISLKWI